MKKITVDNQMDPTTAVNHVYCTGYALDQQFVNNPDLTFKKETNSCVEDGNRSKINNEQDH